MSLSLFVCVSVCLLALWVSLKHLSWVGDKASLRLTSSSYEPHILWCGSDERKLQRYCSRIHITTKLLVCSYCCHYEWRWVRHVWLVVAVVFKTCVIIVMYSAAVKMLWTISSLCHRHWKCAQFLSHFTFKSFLKKKSNLLLC